MRFRPIVSAALLQPKPRATSICNRTLPIVAILLGAACLCSSALAQDLPAVQQGATINREVHHDTSLPLRDLPPAPHLGTFVRPLLPVPRPHKSGPVVDSALQSVSGSLLAPTLLQNFAGVGNGFSGPQGSFTVLSAPPDTNGDVGPNHYVQVVNSDLAIFNKSGTPVYGPVAINTLWSGFGGGCETNNDGDPEVIYDPVADRWVISQFSVSTTPYLECVAVSQTGDPTGAYNRYSFSYGSSDFPDYPKMGVWPDAYYVTYNIFANGATFSGARACALDRAKMLTGAAATQQCFNTGTSYGGILPADLDGARQPPAGSPDYVVGLGASASQIAYWKFHVDWATPGNSTFTGPATLTAAAYAEACNGGTCIPQAGTTQQLDSLADRVMHRLAYRNFGDHEALVVNHSVTAGSSTGVRWYELRPDSSHNLSIFQQGTYAPDSNYRWMGSIAMDQSGNIGLGFSVSGSSLHPEIHYTGRLAGDAVGTMTQGEGTIIDGAGSQTGQSLSRWGDYSSISVDPSDDCTFWYTNEYIPANGAFNWATRIGSFKLPSCGAVPTSDFSISASPTSVSITAGSSGTTTISTAVTSGSAQTVSLSVSGLPSGASAAFSPTSVTTGSSSILTINSGTAAAGTYSLTVTGTGTTATHATPVTLTITSPALTNTATALVASPNPATYGQTVTMTATVSAASGTPAGNVNFMDGATLLAGVTLDSTGKAVFTSSTLSVASHSLQADYLGNTSFAASNSAIVSLPVAVAPTNIAIVSAPSVVYPNNEAVQVRVTSVNPVQPTGNAALTVDGGTPVLQAIDSTGATTFTITSPSVGTHSLSASYAAQGNFAASGPATGSFVVSAADSTTSLAVSPASATWGQAFTLTATVTSTVGTPGGNVTFTDGTTVLGTVALTAGVAQLSYPHPAAGSHTLTASYGGDATHVPSSGSQVRSVALASTTTSVLSGLNPSAYGQPVTFTANIVSQFGGAVSGSVTFRDGTTILATSPLAGNAATFTTSTLTAGSHSISAAYSGDANNSGSTSGPLSQTVNGSATSTALSGGPSPSYLGTAVTFTATVTTSTGPVTIGSVSFMNGTTTLATVALSPSGTAIFTTSTLPAGTLTIVANYNNSANFLPSRNTVTQTVLQLPTATSLASSRNPSQPKYFITFSATVANQGASVGSAYSGIPTGSVTFMNGSSVLATSSLDSSGHASFTTKLKKGSYNITARYAGDPSFTVSVSPTVVEVVQ